MGLPRTPQSEERHKKQGCSFHRGNFSEVTKRAFAVMHHKCETARFDVAPSSSYRQNSKPAMCSFAGSYFKLEVKIIPCGHLENKVKGEVFSAAIFDF